VTAAVCLGLVGRRRPASDARALLANSFDGTDPRTLEAFFRRLGLRVQSGEMTPADLTHHTRAGRPVAALVQLAGGGHWVTVWCADAKAVYWHCPIAGLRSDSPARFRRLWWDWDRFGVHFRQFGVAVEGSE
jgi:ABC-type bacteriocin/lantibiotic exporter with double-glycine peptidase domain